MVDPVLLNRMNDGREIPTQPCQCAKCEGEFFVPALSAEWKPSFCPYCGIRFVRMSSAAPEARR